MSARLGGLLRVAVPVIALIAGACGQIISADFDDLSLDEDGSVGSSGDAGEQGSGGSTQGSGGASGTDGASGTSGAGAGGKGGGGTGGAGGSSGATDGSVGAGGVIDAAGGSAGTMGSAGTAGDGPTAPPCLFDAQEAGLGPVVINELNAETPDFVELYNMASTPCDLAGFKIADAVGVNSEPKYTEAMVFPVGSVIAGHGFVVMIANQANVGGPITCLSTVFPCFTATYGISSTSGERMYFLNSLNATLDFGDWPDPLNDGGVPVGQTVGRLPDGTGQFVYTRSTPGLPNQAP